ncbi:MAG: ferredoxin family protein [Fidelibacterota bacterium]
MANKPLDKAILVVNQEECKSCRLCIEACPVRVIAVSEKLNTRGYHPVYYTGEGCTGCGVCFYACPEPGAITVYKKGYIPEKGEEILIEVEEE